MVVELPNCESLVKYQANQVEIRGKAVDKAEAAVIFGEKNIGDASELLQLLDRSRIERCQNLGSIARGLTFKEYRKIVEGIEDRSERTDTLLIAIMSEDKNLIENWIKQEKTLLP